MADNITAPAAGAVIATDEIGTTHYPITKIAFGALDTATLVEANAPFPVTLGLTDAELRASAVAVTVSGVATAAKQDELITAVNDPVVGRNFFEITPNDSTDIPTRPDGIFIGGAGTIEMQGTDDNAATFTVAAGTILPISPTRILDTGTTATGIVGFTA